MFDSGELRLVLLRLIADQPRHGYDLIRAIEELTHGSYAPSPGVIYPTLTMLQDMGLIEETGEAGPRKAYAATADGKAHLEEKAEEVEALMSRLSNIGDGRRKAGGAPIKRAVRNLLSALWNRAMAEDIDEERLHQLAAILDETAQKIERMK
jgi:DNA-binding PadR family transcriptional regulator